MPLSQSRSEYTVRQESPYLVPPAVYVLVFLAAGAIAYCWGTSSRRAHPPVGPAVATAMVHLREPGAAQAGKPGAGPQEPAGQAPGRTTPVLQLTPEQIRQRILAQADQDARAGLQIETFEGAGPGEWRIAITASDSGSIRAAETVNTLAQSFADAYRADWKSWVDGTCQTAQKAVAGTQRRYEEAKSRLDAWLEGQARAAREAANRAPPPQPVAEVPAGPTLVENPEWVQYRRQLDQLEQRRRELLIDRTPVHPVVQDVDVRLEEVRRQLATLPRQIAAKTAAPAVTPKSLSQNPGGRTSEPLASDSSGISSKNQQRADAGSAPPPRFDPAELERLRQAVAEATRISADAAQAERLASQTRLETPAIDLELAPVRPRSAPAPSRWSAVLAALTAGLTSVTGLGMILTGAAIEPALTTTAEIEAAFPMPVVGVVQQPDPCQTPSARPRRQRLARRGLILAGLLVLAGCLAMFILIPPG